MHFWKFEIQTKCPGLIFQIPAKKQMGFENSHPRAGIGPGLGQAWAGLGPGLDRAGLERHGPKHLDTSEGSGHFLNKTLTFSLAHPHMAVCH